MKFLQNGSANTADSLFSNTGATSASHTKQTVRLNVGKAEKALVRRARTQSESESEGENGKNNDRGRVRREPLQRMIAIHKVIADGKYPNAARLAAELEIGQKTIWRDIEEMPNRLHLPVEYDKKQHGYYYSKRVDGFPGAPALTEREAVVWLVAHKAIEQYHGMEVQKLLRSSFEKLLGQFDNKVRISIVDFQEALSFRPIGPEDADFELMGVVATALSERRVVEFSYCKPGEKEESVRRVHPYHLMCCDNPWYLVGHDEEGDHLRKFALVRMQKPQMLAKRFTQPQSFDAAEYLRGSFAVMTGDGDYEW